jgi:hypothetical protein
VEILDWRDNIGVVFELEADPAEQSLFGIDLVL